MRLLGLAVLALLAVACGGPPTPRADQGVLDLSAWDWDQGPVALQGTWAFGTGFRKVPDLWTGTEAGGRDGQGYGTYKLQVRLPADHPPLALRFGTASTAMAIWANGEEVVVVGQPDPEKSKARPGYAPGTVRVEPGDLLDLEIRVSNHEYRAGGLWGAPVLGPARVVERGQWGAEAAALAMASALSVIGLSTLLLFAYRRSERTFLQLGVFSLVIALRSLVTGEYPLVHLVPTIPFELVIRLEYWTAFLPLPAALLFFNEYFPGMVPRWGARLLSWPSWFFAALVFVLPLDLLTRSLLWYYPVAVPTLIAGTFIVVRRVLRDKQTPLLVGATVLAATGLADMATAAFFTTSGKLVPWGLGLFVVLQATTMAQRFLAAFERTEALLAEKDLLVKEVHHRVKNSLQVVASLVSLQANRIPDPDQKSVYAALRQRITAISLVHEKLYGQTKGGQPDLGEYLRDLLKLQYPRDGLGAGNVTWEVQADPLSASIDYCIDAGLILTELVANAHKHGLTPRGGGRLEVSIRIRESRLAMEVCDDGPGFPPGFRPDAGVGLGFRLVLALLQRNDGVVSITPGQGGGVRVELKLPSAAG